MNRRPFLRSFLLPLAAPLLPAAASDTDARLTQLRQGGNIILMRHAATVAGIGDPAGFQLTECATQRNLSDAGRADAARIGAAFVRLGVPVTTVVSSRWCRCLDTARLAFGRVTPSPMLDSMFEDGLDAQAAKLREVHAWLQSHKEAGNCVLVTHDVNIQALSGRSVRQGEMVVARIGAGGVLRVDGLWRL